MDRRRAFAPGNVSYTLRPLTDADRGDRIELSKFLPYPPTHGRFVYGQTVVIAWCNHTDWSNPSYLVCNAKEGTTVRIDPDSLRFSIATVGDYIEDGMSAASIELGRCRHL